MIARMLNKPTPASPPVGKPRLNRRFFEQAGARGGAAVTGQPKASFASLTPEQVLQMRRLAVEGRDTNWLAAHFGTTPRVVRGVVSGKTYGWVR